MLDYTKAAIGKLREDFVKMALIINYVSQLINITYLVYALFTTNNWIINLLLLLISVAYLILTIAVTTGKIDKVKKKIQKIGKKIFKHSKLLIKAYTLAIAAYGVFNTAKSVTPTSLVLTVFMIAFWIIQTAIEVITTVVGAKLQLIVEGLEADIDTIMKPVKSVGNFFKRATGKEVEPEKEPSKNRILLSERVAEQKQAKKEEKLRLKQEKKARKLGKLANEETALSKDDE